MPEKVKRKAKRSKEVVLLGKELCLVEKGFSKHLMEKSGLIRYAEGERRIRIEIEYNSDSEKGKMTVISLRD